MRTYSVPWIKSLRELQEQYPTIIAEIRGRGYLIGLALHQEPSPIIERLRNRGLLTVGSGCQTIRLLPPLTVSKAELDEALIIIDSVLEEMTRSEDT